MYNSLDISSVIEPVRRLMITSSRLEKESILRENMDNEPFKEMLKYLLDGNRISGISTKKIQKEVTAGFYETTSEEYSLSYLLHYFDTHSTGSDSDIAFVQFYAYMLASQSDIEFEEAISFIYSVITKSLKIGIDVKTVNKVYGKNFIPTLDVMLGTSIENVKLSGNEYIYLSQKLNGTRCFYYKGKLYSRQGKEFENLDHIIKDIKILSDIIQFKQPMVLDGELLLKPSNLNDSEAFQKGTGLANSKEKDKTELRLVLFDIITENDFIEGISEYTYADRKRELLILSDVIKDNKLENISIVPMFYEGTDHDEIWKWLEYAEQNDMEGLMLNLDTPYECKRTKNLIKIKQFYTLDLKVTDIDKGTGRNSDRLGKVYVDFKGNKVGVGSGFSDELRDYYWQHPQEIIGKIIEVKYKEKTKNKDGSESLQFPVFVRVRDDKDEVSYE